MLTFGQPIDFKDLAITGVGSAGFLNKTVTKQVAEQPPTYVSFNIYSDKAIGFFWISIFILGLLVNGTLGVVIYFQKREHFLIEAQRSLFLAKAAEAAHDVQSPLASLRSLSFSGKLTDEMKRSLEAATRSISAIVEDLNGERRLTSVPANDPNELMINSSAARSSLNKNLIKDFLAFRIAAAPKNIEIVLLDESDESYGLPLKQDVFNRTVSNFIDNSIEAIEERGRIEIILRSNDDFNEIEIRDTGKGIPAEVLAKIGTQGFSQGKSSKNTGLGFFSAQRNIKDAGGDLVIESATGKGTKIVASFNRGEKKILVSIHKNERILILDDSELIISTWKQLFLRDLPEALSQVEFFTTAKEFNEALERSTGVPILAFCDYNLGGGELGLPSARAAVKYGRSFLLTGHSNDKRVIAAAAQFGIPILAKSSFEKLFIRYD